MNSKAVIHKTIIEAEKTLKNKENKEIKFEIEKRNYVISQKFKNYAEDYLNILICTHGG